MKNPGFIVTTKNGKKGRTYKSKPLINGKVPVYLCKKQMEKSNICIEYENIAILCDPNSLTINGFID